MEQPMSYSRRKVREFLKIEANEKMRVEIAGNETTARKFLQAMRVELSRLRAIVRSQNRTVKPITLSLVEIITNETSRTVTLVLVKKTENAELSQELNAILADITE